MNNLNQNLYNPTFSHIYIEEKAYDYPLTSQILSALSKKNPTIIHIEHYKDIFNRKNQSFHHQKQAPNLILAVKERNTVYEGAPVCQSFGHEHFYYTSSMMNCIYDCEYCYLQGMYPSANIVVFVNLSDIQKEVHRLLQEHPIYLCISYDTDLLALEPLLGIVHEWIHFLEQEPNLTIELRTKSANLSSILDTKPNNRFILAWTISPDTIANEFEHRVPSLNARIKNIQNALTLGYPVRLCFDPMIPINNWKLQYSELVTTLASYIDFTKINDISIGVFRISADYMNRLRKQRPESVVIQYPYENDHGVFHLNQHRSTEMIQFMKNLLCNYVAEEKIFVWENV